MSAPLAQATRGGVVDAIHRGDLAVVASDGELLAYAGDPATKIAYWRSAAKPFQALPLVYTGAAERWGLDNEDIAFVSGSHNGEPIHATRAASLLERIGRTVDDLVCGTHPPLDREAARALADRGSAPTPLHHNCCGSHAGMLAVAEHLGVGLEGYGDPTHPVQLKTTASIAQFAGIPQEQIAIGVDGCSVPCFGTSVYHLALAFARLMEPEGRVPEPYASAAGVVREAMTAHPYLVAGRGRLDTDLMTIGSGAILSKGGAAGVQCVGLRGGIGVAVKIEDGAEAMPPVRPAGLAAVEALRQLGVLGEEAVESLSQYARPKILTTAGAPAGEGRAVFSLERRSARTFEEGLKWAAR